MPSRNTFAKFPARRSKYLLDDGVCVIETQEVQDRGVEVWHRDFVFGDVVTELVGLPYAIQPPPRTQSPASQTLKACGNGHGRRMGSVT